MSTETIQAPLLPKPGPGRPRKHLLCSYQLIDERMGEYWCGLPPGHDGHHLCYCDDGESCDLSQPDPTEDGDYIVETVRWTVSWPAAAALALGVDLGQPKIIRKE